MIYVGIKTFLMSSSLSFKEKYCLTWHMQLMGEDGSKIVALNKKVRHERSLKGRMGNIKGD